MVKVIGNAIFLSGPVGKGIVEGQGFDAEDVRDALQKVGAGKDVVVHLNSGGGFATEGVACHAALAQHKGRKTVRVEGIAASAASVLAMAGDVVEMTRGAVFMVHCAAAITAGDAQAHKQTITALDAIDRSMCDIYVAKTKRARAQIEEEMRAETWLDANQTVAKKYADRVDSGSTSQKPSAFAWNDAYARAPQQIAAMAGTVALSAGFKAAVDRASAAKAESEEQISVFIRRFLLGRENDPQVRSLLDTLRRESPEAYEKAQRRGPLGANVLAGPWRDVVDEVNQRNGFFALHPAVGK